jgi:uncharacterized membrane protein YhfC
MLAIVYFLNGLLMIVLPLALGVWLARRRGLGWGTFGLGALTFFLSQVLHIPFNQFVLVPALGAEQNPDVLVGLGGALVLGLSAGVFEETTRYIAIHRMKPAERGFGTALMFGAGHGGLEAIVLGGIVWYALLQALTLRGADLAQVVPPEQVALAQAQLEAYWATPAAGVLMGALERASAIMFHLLASTLVMLAVLRRRPVFLALAIFFHMLLNASALLVLPRWGVYVTEAVLLGLGLLALLGVRRLRPLFPAPEAIYASPARVIDRPRVREEGPDEERLDESRFL